MELITIEASSEDKRSFWLLPTVKGDRTLNECMAVFEEWNKKWLDAIDNKQLVSILENLTLLQSVFKNKLQE